MCLTTETQHLINNARKSVLHLRTKKLVTASKRNHRGSFLINNFVYFKASQDCISLRNFLALGFSLLFRNILKTILGQYHIFVRKTRRYCRTVPLSPLISVIQTINIMFQFFPNLTHLCTQLSWD